MVARVQAWIIRSIAAGAFSGTRDVLWFAFTRAGLTTLAALVLNVFVYEVFGRIGLATLPTDPLGDTVVTAFVAGPISFLAFYLVGCAILDLAISRNAFEQLSRIDPLTGLLNRRAFTEEVASLAEPYVIGVIDIDRFKSINDTHGHSAGDKVLVDVAEELRRGFGDTALLARLGGEEFGVALPDKGRDDSIGRFDRARDLMAQRAFDVGGSFISVTFSAGLSSGGAEGYSIMLTDADRALYLAKAAGRNRVVHAEDVIAIAAAAERPPQQRAG